MISLKHISTLSTFNQTKFSADSTDSSYFLGSDQTQIFQGTPDVKYNDLCYIKCSNLQYTHGHLYGSTEVGEAHVSLTQEEYDALSEEEKNNGKIYLIKESTIPGLIDQLPLATTSTDGLMSAEDKVLMQNINTPHIVANGTARSGLITIAEITSESMAEFIVGTMYISGVFQNGNIGGMIINMVCGNGADKTVLKSSAAGICLTDCDVSSGLNGTVYKAIVKIQLSTSCTGGFRMYYVGNGNVKWLI